MEGNYETDILISNRSLETENYDSSTVDYYEYNNSEPVTVISNETDYHETDLSEWRKKFWALLDERYLRNNLGWTYFMVVAYGVIFLIGLVGNCMVILVVIKRPKMRTVTNLFIMNLAVADLLVILFCVPSDLLWNVFRPWILGSVGCKGAYFMKWVSLSASAYSLAAISLDRCKAIYRPQVPPRGLSKRQALFIIGLIWTVSVTLASPLVIVNVVDDDDDRFPICTQVWKNEMYEKLYFLVVMLFLFFGWPLVLISISNIIIWIKVSKRKAPVDCARASRIGRMHRETRQSVGKMLGIVTLVFLLSWLPFYVFWTYTWMMNNYINSKLKDIFMPLMPLLYNSNSSINPVLYAFFSIKFRAAFKSFLPNWLLCVNSVEKNSVSASTTTTSVI